jgi:hypothetical protein
MSLVGWGRERVNAPLWRELDVKGYVTGAVLDEAVMLVVVVVVVVVGVVGVERAATGEAS